MSEPRLLRKKWQASNATGSVTPFSTLRASLLTEVQGLLGLASRVAFKAMNISVSVNDLTNGKRVECKDIVEMLAVEEQIKEAAATFKQILNAAVHFGGEEVIAI